MCCIVQLACSIVKGTLLRPRERRPDRPTDQHHDQPCLGCQWGEELPAQPGSGAGPWLLAGARPPPVFQSCQCHLGGSLPVAAWDPGC